MRGIIVVPLDGSALAEEALPLAGAISRVHVRRMVRPDFTDEDAGAYMERTRDRIARQGFDVSSAVLPDEPPRILLPTPSPGSIAQMLANYALQHGADVVIVTTHGRGDVRRKWLGSVPTA